MWCVRDMTTWVLSPGRQTHSVDGAHWHYTTGDPVLQRRGLDGWPTWSRSRRRPSRSIFVVHRLGIPATRTGAVWPSTNRPRIGSVASRPGTRQRARKRGSVRSGSAPSGSSPQTSNPSFSVCSTGGTARCAGPRSTYCPRPSLRCCDWWAKATWISPAACTHQVLICSV